MKTLRVWFALLLTIPAFAQLGNVLDRLGLGGKNSDSKVALGLKEALHVGTEQCVGRTGRTDGYFRNEAIKILLPEKLRAIEKAMRLAGLGGQLDAFILAMNRAAEAAAPQAKSIFWDALKEMTFDDARKIFTGADTAATDYFRGKTTARLTAAFRPVVAKSMADTGVTRQYDELTARAKSLPFVKLESIDIEQYVVGKSLDGLFHVLGEEERKIRKDPAARVTALLKEVFGGTAK